MKPVLTDTAILRIADNLEMGSPVYYHIPTNEVTVVPDDVEDGIGDVEFFEDFLKLKKKHPKQFLRFENMSSNQSFMLMEDFINQVEDEEKAGRLDASIRRKGPFRNFREELDHYPELLEQWYAYKKNRYIEYVKEQLDQPGELYAVPAEDPFEMENNLRSIRPFIGTKDFNLCRQFYRDLGFEEIVLFPNMSVFKSADLAFYLQNYYVKDWIDNTMVFIEVVDVAKQYAYLQSLDLPTRYPGVLLKPIQYNDWGNECFLHDPSGVLWHFGQFK